MQTCGHILQSIRYHTQMTSCKEGTPGHKVKGKSVIEGNGSENVLICVNSFVCNPKATGKISGYFGELFLLLQDYLQFKFTLVEPTDKKVGSLLGNGSFDGLIGKLQQGEGNWSFSQFMYTDYRSLAVDFSIPISYNPKKLVTSMPPADMHWTVYTEVFTNEFWIVILASICVLTLSLIFLSKIVKNNLVSISDILSFIFTSFIGREIKPIEMKPSGKILTICILLWGFLISCSYNANLVSVLTVSKVTPISSIEELIKSGKYSFLARRTGATTEFLRNVTKNDTCML